MLEWHCRLRRPVAVLVAASAALLAQPSLAWGPLGHRAVGAVADALLTARARRQVERLLAGDLDRDGTASGRTTLAEVSVWADEIRGGDADRPRWHYDNMPVCGAAQDPASWCAQGECASARVGLLLAVLADPARPLRERNEALKWVVHLVGDMHQPLHAADYAEGATRVPVELAGRKDRRALTLHGAWDVRLVEAALQAAHNQPPPPEALHALIERARRFDAAQQTTPVARWLAESNALARDVALHFPGFSCEREDRGTVVLSRGYQQRAERVIRTQLALAGARLAAVLNRALDPG